jgi:hypothetical protein
MDEPRLQLLGELLQRDYSYVLYGGHGRVDLRSLRLVYLSLLTPSDLRNLAANVGLCALTTGVTAPSEHDWQGCLSGGAERCLAPCAHEGDAAGLVHGLFVGRAFPLEPRDVAWVQADANQQQLLQRRSYTAPVPAHAWIEVTHVKISADVPIRQRMWLYPAPGSAVSINVGNTAVIDELDAISSGWFANKWNLSLAMATILRTPPNSYALRLNQYLQTRGMTAAEVAALTTLQRTNHLERTCAQRRHEVVLVRDLGLDEHASIMDAVRRQPSTLTESDMAGRIMCGRAPYLFSCTERTTAVRLMAPYGPGMSGLSDGVRRAVGTCTSDEGPPAPPPPAPPACAKATEFDIEHEACYDWCAHNPSENCKRCKCRACSFCAAFSPSLPPPPPPSPMLPSPLALTALEAATNTEAAVILSAWLVVLVASALCAILGAGLLLRRRRKRHLAAARWPRLHTQVRALGNAAGTLGSRSKLKVRVAMMRALRACGLPHAPSEKLHQRLREKRDVEDAPDEADAHTAPTAGDVRRCPFRGWRWRGLMPMAGDGACGPSCP